MGFSITHLFEGILLFTNAMAILNEQRFLKKCINKIYFKNTNKINIKL